MSESRLRSERAPDPNRSRRVMESRARAQEERAAMAADFRARLTRELTMDGSMAQEALVLSATSTFVEVSVISQRFVRCYANSAELERLHRARMQLSKVLAQLGLTRESEPEPPDEPKVNEWLKGWKTRRKANGRPNAPQSRPSDEPSEPEGHEQ